MTIKHQINIFHILTFVIFGSLFISTYSQQYDQVFGSMLPKQKQVLNIDKVINNTQIPIYFNSKKQSFIELQQLNSIKQLIAINITYSISDGFRSQWPQQKLRLQRGNKISGNIKHLLQQQINSPIKCQLINPKIIFNNHSSFKIKTNKNNDIDNKIIKGKVITNYEQLLSLDNNVILDVWKDQQNQQQNIIFILVSNGQLIIALQSHQSNQIINYQLNVIKLNTQLSNANFNTQRYHKQKKLFIFDNSIRIQIDFNTLNILKINQLNLNHINIHQKQQDQSNPFVDYLWIWNNQYSSSPKQPYLAIITNNSLCLYQYNQSNQSNQTNNNKQNKNYTKTYLPIQSSFINFNTLAKHFKLNIQQMKAKSLGPSMFKRLFYSNQQHMLYIWDQVIGLITCSLSADNTISIFSTIFSLGDSVQLQRIQSINDKTIFYYISNSHLIKYQTHIINNKYTADRMFFRDSIASNGQIVYNSNSQGDFIFVKGQAKINIFKSFRYPKTLQQQNYKIDNIFVFGNQYISVIQNQLTVGQFQVIKQKISCFNNPNYQNTHKLDQNNETTQRTSSSTQQSQQVSQTDQQGQHITQQIPLNMRYNVLIQYLAQCNAQILSSQPYLLDVEVYRKKQYCRYKKIYTDLYIEEQSEVVYKNNQKVQIILIIIFVFSVVILFIGFTIWYIQKRKINSILQSQGLPVGSQDLQTQPGIDNHLNHKLYQN